MISGNDAEELAKVTNSFCDDFHFAAGTLQAGNGHNITCKTTDEGDGELWLAARNERVRSALRRDYG